MTARLMRTSLSFALLFGLTLSAQTPQPVAPADPSALKGKLERVKVYGKSLDGNLMGETASPEVSIYLPPSYLTDPTRRFPVVYLLHGYTSTDLTYFGSTGPRQLHVIADRVFTSGGAREMILVMPNALNAYGGSMYGNSVTTGDWEGYIAENTSGRFMPMRKVPYPPIEWPPRPRPSRVAIVR